MSDVASKITQAMVSLVVTVGSMMMVAISVAPAVQAGDGCSGRGFMGLPTWYRGLTDGQCNIKSPGSGDTATSTFIWRIVLNITEALMMVVGYASVVMIIVGGFFYMTATGQPDKVKSAKGTILNAVIGLVIAMSSVAIVNVVAGMI